MKGGTKMQDHIWKCMWCEKEFSKKTNYPNPNPPFAPKNCTDNPEYPKRKDHYLVKVYPMD